MSSYNTKILLFLCFYHVTLLTIPSILLPVPISTPSPCVIRDNKSEELKSIETTKVYGDLTIHGECPSMQLKANTVTIDGDLTIEPSAPPTIESRFLKHLENKNGDGGQPGGLGGRGGLKGGNTPNIASNGANGGDGGIGWQWCWYYNRYYN